MRDDILSRLRLDLGQRRTVGQLLQEREAATQDICRLRTDVEQLRRRVGPEALAVRMPKPNRLCLTGSSASLSCASFLAWHGRPCTSGLRKVPSQRRSVLVRGLCAGAAKKLQLGEIVLAMGSFARISE